MVRINLATGEVRPVLCGRLTCDPCLARYAQRFISAVEVVARPERAVHLTLVGDPTTERGRDRMRAQLRDYVRRIRARGYAWEWAHFIERNPAGTGYHAHALQHGDYVPQARLQTMWGERIVRVERIKAGGLSRAAAYGSKTAVGRVAGYGSKGVEADPEEHRALNGGRLGGWSRGFFRGMGVRDAMMEAAGESEGEQWVIRRVATA